MALGREELYIKRIENGIRGLKLGTKCPKTAEVGKWMAKLKPLNEPMYEDLLEKYSKVLEEYKKKSLV